MVLFIFHGNVHIGFWRSVLRNLRTWRKMRSFTFGSASTPKLDVLTLKKGYNSGRVHCCRRTSLREGRRSESHLPRANVGRQFKEEMSFYQTEKCGSKNKWLQSLFRFYPGNSAQPTIVLSLYKLTENRTEIILTKISYTYIVLLCKMDHRLERTQQIDWRTSESYQKHRV